MIDNWKKRKTDSPTPRIDTHFRSIGTKVARSSNSAAVNENIAKFAATTSFALLLTDDPFLKVIKIIETFISETNPIRFCKFCTFKIRIRW